MKTPHHHTTSTALRALWPGVSPYEVQAVLRLWWETEPDAVDALIAEVLALPGPDAATRLTAPLLAQLPLVPANERVTVFGALDIVVRAGGDASAAFPAAAEATRDWRAAAAAGRLLRIAAHAGWSLLPVLDALQAGAASSREGEVHRALRLGRLQAAGEHDAVAALAEIDDAHPVGNFRAALGLLEAQLLSADTSARAEAQTTLAALRDAGSDLFAAWQALVPLLRRNLAHGDGDARGEAARMFGQVRFTPRYARDPEAAEAALAANLETVLPVLGAALADTSAYVAGQAAEAIDVYVELGASAAAVRGELTAALQHDAPFVRQHASHALSTWLRAAGEEAELPRGYSHRRRYADTDAAIRDERMGRCELCGAEAVVVIWEDADISQTHAHITVETRCEACGVYGEQHHGYG